MAAIAHATTRLRDAISHFSRISTNGPHVAPAPHCGGRYGSVNLWALTLPPNAAMTATCYFRILAPMYFPIRGDAGEYLSVWSCPQNLWVMDSAGEWVIRRGYFPEGKLWSELANLADAGIIQPLSADDAQWLRHPLPTAAAPSRPALRVIRVGGARVPPYGGSRE